MKTQRPTHLRSNPVSNAGGSENSRISKMPLRYWHIVMWALALGAFSVAMLWSYRDPIHVTSNDIRHPGILALDAALATAVSLGFALRQGSLTPWTNAHFCFRFGLWSAAIFRLLPPILNEDVLYLKNCGTFDVPYVVLGACIHGGVAHLFCFPFALRVLDSGEKPLWSENNRIYTMCGSVVLIFFIVACVVRLTAESW